VDVLIFALAATYVLGGMGIAANNPSVNIFNPRIVFWPLHFVFQGIRCYIPGEIGRNLRRGLRGLEPTPPTPKMKNSELRRESCGSGPPLSSLRMLQVGLS
jgi:hypothetical protein